VSALGQRTLIQHLIHLDSLEAMAREGVPEEIIPDEQFDIMIRWAIAYYFNSGRLHAPSLEAFRSATIGKTTFGEILDDREIEMGDEPEDSVEWALDDLKSSYIHRVTQAANKEFAKEMSEAQGSERLEVLAHYATELIALSMRLSRSDTIADLRVQAPVVMRDYEAREARRGEFRGLRLGMAEVDAHTYGIHEGELCITAAGPKVGKSYLLCWIALAEWLAGRSPCLFTLENSVEMMLDRIACIATGTNSTQWQRGECLPEDKEKMNDWLSDMERSDVPLRVLRPDIGSRSFPHMVRQAQVLEADSLLVDQLTHVELPEPRKPKHERIGDALHHLKALISTGRDRIQCVLAHQINREGVQAARKVGHLEMYHLAEASECERTADWVFGMYASRDDQNAERLKFQTLASRRAPIKHWNIDWAISDGSVVVRDEFVIT